VFQNTMIVCLRLRFRYMFITSPNALGYQQNGGVPKCRFCDTATLTSSCVTCLELIAKSCAWIYNAGFDNRDLRTRINSEDVDPFTEITIIGATCLLKLARFDSQQSGLTASAAQSLDLKLLLQAIAWLSSHYSRVPQKNQGMPVLLTKLYLLAGCVSHAKELWDSLEVKNVTLDSLGPLFSDRLSSIAPGMWRASGGTPMYPYHKHYNDAIRRNIPTNIRTALEHGSYTSVLGLLRAQDRLGRSCTMIMSNVEDRRGLRAIGSKFAFEVKDDPLLRRSCMMPLSRLPIH
jgi:N-terminal acetyltransferase B complex non-catalytic subunit